MDAQREELLQRLFKFRPAVDRNPATLDEFHEWCCQLAVDTFNSKKEVGEGFMPLFVMQPENGLHVLQSDWHGDDEKHLVQDLIRKLCAVPMMGIRRIATLNEVWIASAKAEGEDSLEKLKAQYGEVRNFPNCEDGLFVQSFERGGGLRITKWVAKLHPTDVAKNRLLARDDVEITEGMKFSGANFGYFAPAVPS